MGFMYLMQNFQTERLIASVGGVVTIADLLVQAPRPDEAGDGWAQTETSRLGRLARRLWDGLLVREEVSAR